MISGYILYLIGCEEINVVHYNHSSFRVRSNPGITTPLIVAARNERSGWDALLHIHFASKYALRFPNGFLQINSFTQYAFKQIAGLL